MDFSTYKQLEFRRRFWKILGAAIHVSDPATGAEVGYIEQKAWVLKEDVRFFTDSSKATEVFRIHARSVIDFGATYDVVDSNTESALFSLRRKGLRSTFVRDHWEIYSPADAVVGEVQETSQGLALVRRYVSVIPFIGTFIDLALSFAPLTYQVRSSDGKVAANLTHRKNPIIVKFGLEQTGEPTNLDPRVSVAAVSMLAVIDASKN
jgi:hypothetical protein